MQFKQQSIQLSLTNRVAAIRQLDAKLGGLDSSLLDYIGKVHSSIGGEVGKKYWQAVRLVLAALRHPTTQALEDDDVNELVAHELAYCNVSESEWDSFLYAIDQDTST